MLGPVILAASRSDTMRRAVSAAPVTKPVVNRFIAGESVEETTPVIRTMADSGLEITLDVLGEDITDRSEALAARDAYLRLIEALAPLELGTRAEMSVKLSSFGQALPGGHGLALENVTAVVEAAAEIGTTVTLDAEDHTTIDSMLAIHGELRERFPQTGAVVQSYLFRTEEDCRALAAMRLARPPRQGRLQGARLRRPPGQGRGRQGVHPLAADPDGGRRLPDGRHPRPAHRRDRPGPRPACRT